MSILLTITQFDPIDIIVTVTIIYKIWRYILQHPELKPSKIINRKAVLQ